MRAAAFLCLFLLATLVAAPPADAKGAESLTITGPGLDEPLEIRLMGDGTDDTPSYLVIALLELANPYTMGNEVDLSPNRPPRPLNDRYTLTWQMAHPSDADPSAYTVIQDVYPNAMGTPVIHVRRSTWLRSEGGWTDSSPALLDTLAALGVPLSGATPALVSTRASTTTPRSDDPTVWQIPVAAATGLAAGLAVGVRVTKRRQAAQT